MKISLSFLCAVLLLVLLCALPIAAGATKAGDGLGSCKHLSDRTIIVSVFANDTATKWDWDKRSDYDQFQETYKRVGTAVAWIQKEAKASKVQTDLLWDFMNTPYLYAEATFDVDMHRNDGLIYWVYERWIEKHGHLEFLKKHFNADSILYAFYYNSPKDLDKGSYTFTARGQEWKDFTEVCVFFTRNSNIITVPAAYAHELLHCFGGVDMYRANPGFNMSQEFIDWFRSRYPRDLYAVTYHGDQKKVNYELSYLTRYYLGMVPRPATVDRWGLKLSDFELQGY